MELQRLTSNAIQAVSKCVEHYSYYESDITLLNSGDGISEGIVGMDLDVLSQQTLLMGPPEVTVSDERIEAKERMTWLVEAMRFVRGLLASQVEKDLFDNVSARARLVLSTSDCVESFATRATNKQSSTDILVSWCNVFEASQTIKQIRLPSDHRCTSLGALADKLGSASVVGPILTFVRQVVADGAEPEFLAKNDEIGGSLPKDCAVLIKSVHAANSMKAMAEHVKRGSIIGLLACNTVLQQASLAAPPISTQESFLCAKKVVNDTWSSLVSGLMSWAALPGMQEFMDKYERSLLKAVETWTFTDDMAFLKQNLNDPVFNATMSAAARILQGALPNLRHLSDLLAEEGNLPWATSDELEQIKAYGGEKRADLEKATARLGVVVGCFTFTNRILTDKMNDGIKVYVTKQLRIHMETLPQIMQDKVAQAVAPKKGAKVAPTESAAPAATAVAPPDTSGAPATASSSAAPSAPHVGVPAKKRYRRM